MSVRRKACCSTGAPFYSRPENTDTEVFSQEVIQDTDLTHYKLLYLKTCGHWFYANKICEYYATRAKMCAVEQTERDNMEAEGRPIQGEPKCDMICPMCREQFYPSDLDWVDPPIPATVEGLQELFAEKELAQKKLKHWQVNTMGRPFKELYDAMRAFMKQKLATSEHDSGETVFKNNNGDFIMFSDKDMDISSTRMDAGADYIVKEYRPWTTREVAILANSPWERRKGGSVLVDGYQFASVSQFLTAALSRQKNEDICDAMNDAVKNPSIISDLKQEIEDWLYGYFGEDENPGSLAQSSRLQHTEQPGARI